jgi:hypothetical protein
MGERLIPFGVGVAVQRRDVLEFDVEFAGAGVDRFGTHGENRLDSCLDRGGLLFEGCGLT